MEPVFAQNQSDVWYKQGKKGLICQDSLWSELLSGEAETKAFYTQSYKKDEPVVTRHAFGSGFAWYAGTQLQGEVFQALLRDVCKDAKLTAVPSAEICPGVEIVRRIGDGEEALFLFNWNDSAETVSLSAGYQDYLSGEKVGEHLILAAQEFAILHRSQP